MTDETPMTKEKAREDLIAAIDRYCDYMVREANANAQSEVFRQLRDRLAARVGWVGRR